jgi:hypothetical protein
MGVDAASRGIDGETGLSLGKRDWPHAWKGAAGRAARYSRGEALSRRAPDLTPSGAPVTR